MAYDHSDKIGNQGDLVKHYALYLCLKKLLDNHPANTPFIYAESHLQHPRTLARHSAPTEVSAVLRGEGEYSESEPTPADRAREIPPLRSHVTDRA